MKKLKYHIFICENERPEGHVRGSCLRSGAQGLVDLFKKTIREKGIHADIRAQRAGCLDVCENGPSVVVYPEGVWYGKVQLEDVNEIIESHLVNGVPLERLKISKK